MNFLLLATEALNGHPAFLHNLSYQTVGLAIVMTSLGGLAVIVSVVAALLAPLGSRSKAPLRPLQAVMGGAATEDEAGDELHAVVAAAVHVALGKPHKILSVQPVRNVQLQAWSVEGRRQIFHSHTLR